MSAIYSINDAINGRRIEVLHRISTRRKARKYAERYAQEHNCEISLIETKGRKRDLVDIYRPTYTAAELEIKETHEMLEMAERIQFPGRLNAGIALIRLDRGWLVRDWDKADDEIFPTVLEAFASIREEIEIWSDYKESANA
jgi:hypothetical protein